MSIKSSRKWAKTVTDKMVVALRIRQLLKVAPIGVVLLVMAFVGYGIANAQTRTKSTKASYSKQLRAMPNHKSIKVCAAPAAHKASCAALVSVSASGSPLTGSPAVTGSLGPVEFHTAYNLPCTPGGPVAATCATPVSFGPTIAIVDAGSYNNGTGTVEQSLHNYDALYGLPECTAANGCLTIVNQTGAASPLPADSGWSMEIALDVEIAHMTCQTCKILLVEADDSYLTSLTAAITTAASFSPVAISNSWYIDTLDDTALDDAYNLPGIAILAATGDAGAAAYAWPADNPNVIAVSGTTLSINNDNTWGGETVWSYAGGGCSSYYTAPTWQSSLPIWATSGCGGYRAIGDLSADADPNSGAYIDMATSNSTSNAYNVGGTSLATPLLAGIFGLIGKIPSGVTASSIPYLSNTSANFHDVITGTNCLTGGQLHCAAGVGFDTPSGVGSPIGIGGFTPPPTQPTGLTTTLVNQTSIDLNWTASTDNLTVSGYHVYRDGIEIATTALLTYSDTGLTPNSSYVYSVVAYDIVGNLSIASTTVNATAYYNADINMDGHVDLLDLSLLANKYGQCGGSLGRVDINNDGCVDLLDLSLLANKYGL